MRRKNHSHQQDIEDLRKQNNMLEQQIKSLERARSSGNFGADNLNEAILDNMKSEASSPESSDENDENERKNKRLKTATY